ncbi:MAG: helix-turn-helix transcriptional regulator [Burkholderiales bacterium]|nr:helix-turn-helix transcriptional regulator [Burkholderiales bacterium]
MDTPSRAEDDWERALLRRLCLPIFLVDANLHVHYATQPARCLCTEGAWILLRGSHLALAGRLAHQQLQQAVRRLSLGDTTGRRLAVRPSTERELLLVEGDRQAGAGGLVLVTVCSFSAPEAPEPLILGECFGLTAAESRVAAALASGHTVKGIAHSAGTSPATTRTHLRRILAKVGVRRQADLVGLLCRMGTLMQLLPSGALTHA